VLLAMALDLSVPPLSLLVLVWIAITAAAAAAWVFLGTAWQPAAVLGVAGLIMAAAVAAGWAALCRDAFPLKAFLNVPAYLLRKAPIYASFCLLRRQREWVRTERSG
jgi:hypothetical protein